MISNSKRFLTRTLIRYPGVTYKKGINHEVNKKPLIFIFGWLGAAPKYINKYESMYNRKGNYNYLFQKVFFLYLK